jgi:hypothetical protein
MNFIQMKLKIILTIFLLYTGAEIFIVRAQSLAIRMKDGTEQTIGLSTLENVTFLSGNILLNRNTGTSESYSLSKIKKIYFESVPTGTENKNINGSSGKISCYPNPVESIIYFRNIPGENTLVRIYKMDGKMILQSLVSYNNNSLNISELDNGFYILSVNNQVFKFIKQ